MREHGADLSWMPISSPLASVARRRERPRWSKVSSTDSTAGFAGTRWVASCIGSKALCPVARWRSE